MLLCAASLFPAANPGFAEEAPAPARERVAGPNGALVVEVELNEGRLSYRVVYNGQVMVEPSPLGLETDIGCFASGLRAAGKTEAGIDETYTLPHGKASRVRYQANELTSRYTDGKGGTLEVIFRVSNNDVALAYRLSHTNRVRAVIRGERTGFRFPKGTTKFVTPQAPWGTGWMATKPSYEEEYMVDAPVGARSQYGLGFTFPALFRVGDKGWALLSETGVSSRYAGTRLGDSTSDGVYPIVFPEPAENAGFGDATAQVALPALTSWKTITVGDTLRPVVETTVSWDVVTPLFEPAQPHRPGRAAWSWLLWQDGSINFDDQKTFINLADALNFEYVLVDNWWDQRIGRERVPELVQYAAARGVSVILWYNSNGAWNDAPQTPQDLMDTAPARHRELAWLRSVGVKGIKVDFFGGDKQATMKLYEDILTDANLYGINVNFHGATLPRGWERMYPNHMTSEAVLGSEFIFFDQRHADREALTSTLLPFTRNTTASMDFAPVLLQRRLSRDGQSGNIRRTTDAFQLATAVLYQSGIQHFGLTPMALEQQPDYVLDFLRKAPATWDETRFIDGFPGRFVVLARRAGADWYVAATHAEKQRKELTLRLPEELRGRGFRLLHDKPDGSAGLRNITVGDDGAVSLVLEPGGGAVLHP